MKYIELFNNEEIMTAWVNNKEIFYLESGQYIRVSSSDDLIELMYYNEHCIFTVNLTA